MKNRTKERCLSVFPNKHDTRWIFETGFERFMQMLDLEPNVPFWHTGQLCDKFHDASWKFIFSLVFRPFLKGTVHANMKPLTYIIEQKYCKKSTVPLCFACDLKNRDSFTVCWNSSIMGRVQSYRPSELRHAVEGSYDSGLCVCAGDASAHLIMALFS